MPLQRHWFRRPRTAFRPRIERLERRDYLSCTVFQRGETLVILGDREANQIAIADTREGDIAVTCDRGETERFAGVERIVVETFAGDDEVTATFVSPPEPVFHFRADLGAGDDRLSISGFDPQPDPPLLAVAIDIHAGAGNDDVTATLKCPSDGYFQFRADLGGGDDRLSIGGFDPQPDPPGRLIAFDIHAGAGDDEVSATFTCPSDGYFQFRADLGAGNDRLSISGFDPQPDPPIRLMSFDILAGAGDDEVRATFVCPADPSFPFRADLGAGDDRLDLNWTSPPDPVRPGETSPPEPVRALALEILGGAGDDLIKLSMTGLEIAGRFDLAVLGGVGNDIIESFIVPCILPTGRANLVFDGQAGNDRIAVRVEMDEDSGGALAARVLGGLGDDDLTLALYGVDDLSLLVALVDGGRGYDIARVTRNVRVGNCEEVLFLDEPR